MVPSPRLTPAMQGLVMLAQHDMAAAHAFEPGPPPAMADPLARRALELPGAGAARPDTGLQGHAARAAAQEPRPFAGGAANPAPAAEPAAAGTTGAMQPAASGDPCAAQLAFGGIQLDARVGRAPQLAGQVVQVPEPSPLSVIVLDDSESDLEILDLEDEEGVAGGEELQCQSQQQEQQQQGEAAEGQANVGGLLAAGTNTAPGAGLVPLPGPCPPPSAMEALHAATQGTVTTTAGGAGRSTLTPDDVDPEALPGWAGWHGVQGGGWSFGCEAGGEGAAGLSCEALPVFVMARTEVAVEEGALLQEGMGHGGQVAAQEQEQQEEGGLAVDCGHSQEPGPAHPSLSEEEQPLRSPAHYPLPSPSAAAQPAEGLPHTPLPMSLSQQPIPSSQPSAHQQDAACPTEEDGEHGVRSPPLRIHAPQAQGIVQPAWAGDVQPWAWTPAGPHISKETAAEAGDGAHAGHVPEEADASPMPVDQEGLVASGFASPARKGVPTEAQPGVQETTGCPAEAASPAAVGPAADAGPASSPARNTHQHSPGQPLTASPSPRSADAHSPACPPTQIVVTTASPAHGLVGPRSERSPVTAIPFQTLSPLNITGQQAAGVRQLEGGDEDLQGHEREAGNAEEQQHQAHELHGQEQPRRGFSFPSHATATPQQLTLLSLFQEAPSSPSSGGRGWDAGGAAATPAFLPRSTLSIPSCSPGLPSASHQGLTAHGTTGPTATTTGGTDAVSLQLELEVLHTSLEQLPVAAGMPALQVTPDAKADAQVIPNTASPVKQGSLGGPGADLLIPADPSTGLPGPVWFHASQAAAAAAQEDMEVQLQHQADGPQPLPMLLQPIPAPGSQPLLGLFPSSHQPSNQHSLRMSYGSGAGTSKEGRTSVSSASGREGSLAGMAREGGVPLQAHPTTDPQPAVQAAAQALSVREPVHTNNGLESQQQEQLPRQRQADEGQQQQQQYGLHGAGNTGANQEPEPGPGESPGTGPGLDPGPGGHPGGQPELAPDPGPSQGRAPCPDPGGDPDPDPEGSPEGGEPEGDGQEPDGPAVLRPRMAPPSAAELDAGGWAQYGLPEVVHKVRGQG